MMEPAFEGRTCVFTLKHCTEIILFFFSSSPHLKQWGKGCVLGSAQNFARELMETPSNHMTPTMFVDSVSDRIGQLKSDAVQVIPRYVLRLVLGCHQRL